MSGYAAHFKDVTAEKLFAIEEAGDCDDPRLYVEGLLVMLAAWRADLERWRDSLDPSLPFALSAYRSAAAEYGRALDAVREAWLQWSFQAAEGPSLPERFDLPPAGGAVR
ncbi:hypothetical protein ACGRHY_18895 [Streptomyces sp. HK10]|uniref:hypothetical protein n=1 Tax=Streptomyces sp. HK10 TaxID=3373255 RepID=UPI003748A164